MNTTQLPGQDDLLLLYVPVMIWTFLLVVYFFFLGRKFTFGNWTASNPNPYCDETLGLPKGTFRGVLTITIMFVAILLEVFTLRNPEYEKHTEKFLTAFQMVLAFYFGSQVMSTLTKAETKKTEAIVNAAENPSGNTEVVCDENK